MHGLPLPRLLDRMGAEGGPSSAEEEKEAKRQRSAPTTPRSATSTLPHDSDRVMGVVSLGHPIIGEVWGEDDAEFKEVEEMPTHSQTVLEEAWNDEHRQHDVEGMLREEIFRE